MTEHIALPGGGIVEHTKQRIRELEFQIKLIEDTGGNPPDYLYEQHEELTEELNKHLSTHPATTMSQPVQAAPVEEGPLTDLEVVQLHMQALDPCQYADAYEMQQACLKILEPSAAPVKDVPGEAQPVPSKEYEGQWQFWQDGDRFYHAKDQTWWKHENGRLVRAVPPSAQPTGSDEECAREIGLFCFIETPACPAMGQTPTAVLNTKKASTIIAAHRQAAEARVENKRHHELDKTWDEAKIEGFVAGYLGKSMADNPYPNDFANFARHGGWDCGLDNGQSAIRKAKDAALAEQAAEIERLRDGLNRIKARCVGEAAPNWPKDVLATQSRMFIADVCDIALATVKGYGRG